MKPSKFQFVSPYLKDVSFRRNRECEGTAAQSELQHLFQVRVKRIPGKQEANVELELKMGTDDTGTPFQLDICVASDFLWEDISEETAEKLLKTNAPALLLGYMRPMVASLTGFSDLPAYHLPFVNFKD